MLGSGGFARVYLARQVSLDRLVALKVSPDEGSEARTLARLEHQHIVQVFSEFVDAAKNLRLLCMQFVPGVTLAHLIDGLKTRRPETWNGRTILETLDELCNETTTFDLGGLGIRAFLETFTHAEAVCWLGARLAEALAHAHSQGIVHRDIKPANILVNQYGRPLLADFNIALNSAPGCAAAFGGTLAYMAPEHIDAFNEATGIGPEAVDCRSDLYSLNVVLFEFLTGRLPFKGKIESADVAQSLRDMAGARRAGAPSPRALRPEVPEVLDRLVRRCLEPRPERRYQSAAEFMHALDGCRELLHVEKETASAGMVLRWCEARPFFMLVVLALLPHFVGSALNITYNELLIVQKNDLQQAYFYELVTWYNVVVYPLLIVTAVVLAGRVYRGWRRIRHQPDLPAAESAKVRRQALRLPGWSVALSCLGWFSGGVFFPVALHAWAGPIAGTDFFHFLLSFVLSGLIALTYSYLGVQFVVLRVLYPALWSDPAGVRTQAPRELRGVAARLRFYQLLAVLIPLTGAGLLIGVGPDQLSLGFRLLVTALMVLGFAGFVLATRVSNQLAEVLSLLSHDSERMA